ncbi:nucleolus protein [Lentinula guzmanii]|uniref:25S rRNA adenine-N(1) methyltransferase n=1 Tax=Lentinula guzmanii TaxID=2804957 RepID=A0AA38JVZ2_9AGAR|nr:nucleolus protein [Lentinula guzmanii]
MPKSRKRKVPITSTGSTYDASSKPESGRTVIRRFHVLLKLQAQLQKAIVHDSSKKAELVNVENELEELGGLKNYQRMSAIGQGTDRGGGSEKMLIRWLKDKELHKTEKKLRLLEVGALKPDNYASCSSWIEATPMDLNSRHPSIIEQDFLLLDQEQNREKWDIISLSLVLNFVPEPPDRGRMLCLAYDFLVGGGHLFVALPLPCLSNSRYLNFDLFIELMEFLGFTELQRHWREGGKMIYILFIKKNGAAPPRKKLNAVPEKFTKKTVLRQGNRNNFSITVCTPCDNIKTL